MSEAGGLRFTFQQYTCFHVVCIWIAMSDSVHLNLGLLSNSLILIVYVDFVVQCRLKRYNKNSLVAVPRAVPEIKGC